MPNKLEEAGISWVILGSQTRPAVSPKIEWVQEIVKAADQAGVKVFLKDNLVNHLTREEPFIHWLPTSVGQIASFKQEMPKGSENAY